MADIFSCKPLPRNRAPAPIFPLFITALERHLIEQRKLYDAMASHERLYTIVRDAVAALNLPHAQRLTLSREGVHYVMQALPTDRYRHTYPPIIEAIEKALIAADLRHNTTGRTLTRGEYDRALECFIKAAGGGGNVYIRIDLPADGIADLRVRLTTRPEVQHYYEFTEVGDEAGPKPAETTKGKITCAFPTS